VLNASMPDPPTLAAVVSAQEIRTALARDELVLHYQPVVDLPTGRARGVEALLRWMHPQGGLLSPEDFLPAVVQTPVMDEVTRWVLSTACAALREWPAWTMAVNVSARDLARPRFLAEVRSALERTGVAPTRLLLELTEGALVQDLPAAVRTLTELRRLGVRLALDDFGTGYSSMLYLRELPVTEIKIDRIFVSGLGVNAEDTAIVASLINLARAVNLSVVAEGVEIARQRDQLHALGCPFGQGYHFSRPRPADELDPALKYGPAAPSPRHRARRRGGETNPIVLQRMQELLDEGASLHTIASALNRAGLRTQAGVRWHPATVAQALTGAPPRSAVIELEGQSPASANRRMI